MYEFTSTEQFNIKDRGDVYVVLNPFEYKRTECPFTGNTVIINGKEFKVIGVESNAVDPVRKGSRIGLLVENESLTGTVL